MKWICVDGKMMEEDKPALTVSNRAFRYGEGIFETMKVIDGKIQLQLYHTERLFSGLDLLGIKASSLSEESIQSNLSELLLRNNCAASARVRLSVFRNENDAAGYVIEAGPLQPKPSKPWMVDIYPYGRKSIDAFSPLKSINYLPYIMAGRYAGDKKLDEVFVLNSEGKISDGSKTNVFLVHDNRVSTPALHQGCVAGVMRRHVMDLLKEDGIGIHQVVITEDHLLEAEEVFVTNAIIGVQPVGQFREKEYATGFTSEITSRLFPNV